MPRNTDTTAATQWHVQQRVERQRLYEQNPRKCQRCENPLPYGSDKRKIYCNHSCAAINNNANGKYVKKPCALCGAMTKHTFCSKQCQSAHNKQQTISRWLNGDVLSDSEDMPNLIRHYMLEEANNQCSCCGWAEVNQATGKIPLTIDHIDGNSRNHARENLKVLCPNCHSLTPTYGILNKGNGRRKRR